jgi:hypothetical protein
MSLTQSIPCADILDAAHSLFTSSVMSVAEETQLFSKIFSPGCQAEERVAKQPQHVILPIIHEWMRTTEELWGVTIAEVFTTIQVPSDKMGTALFTLLMNCMGHGISLSDDYDMKLAYEALGDRMKAHKPAPDTLDDDPFYELAYQYCRDLMQ